MKLLFDRLSRERYTHGILPGVPMMDFACLTKSIALSIAICFCGLDTSCHADDAPSAVVETPGDPPDHRQMTAVDHCQMTARLIWAIVDAIENQHLASPPRRELIEIVARELEFVENVPNIKKAIAEISRHESADTFSEWLCDLWQDRSTNDFDQFVQRIIARLQSKFGHLRLIPEKELIVEDQLRNNRYVGIGVNTNSNKGVLTFPIIVPGGPADRAGLKAGTIVDEIDGRSARQVTVETAVEWIRGPAGTDVTLTIADPGPNQQFRRVTLKRGVVRLDSVVDRNNLPLGRGSIRSGGLGGVGWIKVRDMTSSTLSELREAEVQARTEGIRILVLEFGAFSQSNAIYHAQLVADGLLDDGTLWYREERGDFPRPVVADRECLFRGIPIIVVLHQHTGPAQSAIAAALQDAGRALIVGDEPQFDGILTSAVKLAGIPFALEMSTARLTRAYRDRQWPVQPDYRVEHPVATKANRQPMTINAFKRLEPQKGRPRNLLVYQSPVSALFPANVTLGRKTRDVAFREFVDSSGAIRPRPHIMASNAADLAEAIAWEVLKSLPEELAE